MSQWFFGDDAVRKVKAKEARRHQDEETKAPIKVQIAIDRTEKKDGQDEDSERRVEK
ncbi:MAG: hypothetical protein MJ078_04525 [Clostridia bacterium]|nr:hypothetical protein [Clostridia bacterium]